MPTRSTPQQDWCKTLYRLAHIPNLRHLRMVQVIGQLGSVNCASRDLSTSQPAVTQAVSNLEADIGVPIFERGTNGSFATPMGRIYLLRVDRFFEILDRAISQVLGWQDGRSARKAKHVDQMITATQLRALIATSEQGRLNEIAAQLNLFPASLLRSARTLEAALGKPLFDRTAQGLIPNRTGTFLAREFRRAAREIDLARGEILLASRSQSLEIIVGAMPMAGSVELVEATQRFKADFPDVKVRLITGDYHKLLDDLCNSRIDMIFGLVRKPDWASDVTEQVLFNDSYCLVSRPGHALSALEAVTPEDLTRYQWVVPTEGTPRRDRIEQIFAGMAQPPRFDLETSSLTLCRAFLLRSDTITLMTRSEVQSDLDLGILVGLPCPLLDTVLIKGVTMRNDWLPTRAHSAFLNALRTVTAATHHDDGAEQDGLKLVC